VKQLDNLFSKLNLTKNRKKIVKNVFWAMLGKTINLLSALFVGILVARYLGPEQYGLMNYVISYVSLFSVLASFGLENIEIRELSRIQVSKELILGTAFRLRLVFALVTILLILLTLLLFESDIFTISLVMIYSLSIIGTCFSVIRNYFTSIVLNEYVVKTEIRRTIIGAGIKILLLLLNVSLIWFIIASTFDFILVAGGYVYSYRKIVGSIDKWKFDLKIAKHLLKESYPLLLSGAAVVIYQRIDQVMIGKMIDHKSVGYFATASRFTDLILFLPLIMVQTVTPLLVRVKEESEEHYKVKKQQFLSIIVWTSIFMAFSVSVTSFWLISWTFGSKYLLAVPVLQILSWKAVGIALASASGQLIVIERLQKYAFIRNFIGVVICVGLNLIFIPKFGIIGSAIVTIVTATFTGFLANIFIPPYHSIMKMQLKAILLGWRELIYLKTFFK
jgi:O-antigen/teichoic acid export membrane protein